MKIEIGNTYLDSWGHQHTIQGLTRNNPNHVWSLSSHFDFNGKNVGGGYNLVVLPPEKEIKHWQDFIKQVEAVNDDNHLKLVKLLLDNMRERIHRSISYCSE